MTSPGDAAQRAVAQVAGKDRGVVEAASGEEVPRLTWGERRMAVKDLLVPHMLQPGPPAMRTFRMPWEFMGARRGHIPAALQPREDRHGKAVQCRMAQRQ